MWRATRCRSRVVIFSTLRLKDKESRKQSPRSENGWSFLEPRRRVRRAPRPRAPGLAAGAPSPHAVLATRRHRHVYLYAGHRLACLSVSFFSLHLHTIHLYYTNPTFKIDHHRLTSLIVSRSMNLSRAIAGYCGGFDDDKIDRTTERSRRSHANVVPSPRRGPALVWRLTGSVHPGAPCARDRHRLSLCSLPLRCRWARTALSRALGRPPHLYR